jgi:uncharacterized protein (DUF1800 family)
MLYLDVLARFQIRSKSRLMILRLAGSLLTVSCWGVLQLEHSTAQVAMPSPTAGPATDAQILHVLNRLGYGPTPGDLQRLRTSGLSTYIREQLNPEQLPESSLVTQRLQSLNTLQMSQAEILQVAQGATNPISPQLNPLLRFRQTALSQVMEQRVLRALNSPRQLQERLVEFWFNHFNVDAGRPMVRVWTGAYELQAIRPHVLGNFRQLLGATAQHPAMLVYLDNALNTAPQSPGVRGRFRGLNENYARELMELHTLGVKGGYTQQDVISLSRIFTGWGLCRPDIAPLATGASPSSSSGNSADINSGNSTPNSGFCFDSRRHDYGEKVFLGQKIPGTGMAEGERALDLLARHPATARHISYKLAQYFVADQPPSALVARLAQRFQATDGNLRAVLETLFNSPEFWSPQAMNAKFKSPQQYVFSTLRATGAPLTTTQPIAGALDQMGMPLYRCATPNGYSSTQSAWLSPDAMNRRLNYVTELINTLNRQTPAAGPTVVALYRTLGRNFSPSTLQSVSASPASLRPALILGSPEFMRH